MAGPLGLTTIDLGTLPNIVTSPTYTDIFNETVGVLGTGADGMSARIAELADRAAAFEADVALGDGDLAETISAGGAQDVSTANELAAFVPAVSVAGDALLGNVNSLVSSGTTPTPTPVSAPAPAPCAPGSVVAGLTIGQTDPHPYPAIPGVAPNFVTNANTMCVGNPPQIVNFGSEYETYSGPLVTTITLHSGDPAIFAAKVDDSRTSGVQLVRDLNAIITPAKAGRFQAVYNTTNTGGQVIQQGLNVTIVAKGT